LRAHLRRSLATYMDAVARVLEGCAADDDPSLPPAVRVQALLADRDDAVTSGQHSPVDEAELRRRAARLSASPVDAAAVQRIVEALDHRPDEEVAQMRPFELARQWGQDRRHVLQAFLHGTRAGLVDLDWQINCPVCRVAAQVVSSLAEVGNDLHCETCNIRYDLDFGANVEAVFRCNAAVRAVEPAVYCEASPSLRPHVLAQLRVEPGATRELTLALLDGRVHLRTLGAQRAADLLDEPPPECIEIEIGEQAVTATASGQARDGR